MGGVYCRLRKLGFGAASYRIISAVDGNDCQHRGLHIVHAGPMLNPVVKVTLGLARVYVSAVPLKGPWYWPILGMDPLASGSGAEPRVLTYPLGLLNLAAAAALPRTPHG